MKTTTTKFTDLLIRRERKEWSPKMMDMIHTHNAVDSFINTTFKDIQKRNAKAKTRGMSFEFEINDIEVPKDVAGKKFAVRTWEGMGRIVIHVGEVGEPGEENYISMVGPEEGDQHPGMQGINWDTNTAAFVLWYIEDRWYSFKNKFVDKDTIQII